MIQIEGDSDGGLLIVRINMGNYDSDLYFTLDISTENNDIAQVHYMLHSAIITSKTHFTENEIELYNRPHQFHEDTSIKEIFFSEDVLQICIRTKEITLYISEKTANKLLKVILKTREKLEKDARF